MLSAAIDWERIERFVGFGRPDAPVVFVGMEEGLDPAGDLDAELRLRSTYAAIMDRRDASLGTPGFEAMFDPERAPMQKTWRAMAHIMLWRRHRTAPTVEAVRRYIALELGRSSGDALLTELMPYPHPSIGDWLYARFKRFENRETYRKALLPQRKALLRQSLHQSPRDSSSATAKATGPTSKISFRISHGAPKTLSKSATTAPHASSSRSTSPTVPCTQPNHSTTSPPSR